MTPPPAPVSAASDTPLLQFSGVTRRFGRTVALDGFDLEVAPGTVVGLAGRNGAGKTTALRLAAGLLWPDGGTIRACGLEPRRHGVEVRRRVSLMADESELYPSWTAAQLFALAAGVHPRWDDVHARALARRLDLPVDRRVRELSRGGKAKIALVLAAACRPDVLLLDDPTAGLDPLARREVLEGILDAVPDQGGAVVYATHLVADLERLADRIVFLDRGRVRFDGTLDELRARVRQVSAVFTDGAPPPPDVLRHLPGVLHVRVDERLVTVVVDGDAQLLGRRLEELGGTDVLTSDLPLEEILVAALRHGEEERA